MENIMLSSGPDIILNTLNSDADEQEWRRAWAHAFLSEGKAAIMAIRAGVSADEAFAPVGELAQWAFDHEQELEEGGMPWLAFEGSRRKWATVYGAILDAE